MTEDKIDLIGLSLNEISETLINKDLIPVSYTRLTLPTNSGV